MCGKAGAQQEFATAAQQVHGRCAGFVRFFMNLLRPITNMFEGHRAAYVALKYNVFQWNLKIFHFWSGFSTPKSIEFDTKVDAKQKHGLEILFQ